MVEMREVIYFFSFSFFYFEKQIRITGVVVEGHYKSVVMI